MRTSTPIYLSPADAGAAFARDRRRRMAVWDPFFAIAEKSQGARVLVNASDVIKTFSFYLANTRLSPHVTRKSLNEALGGLAEAANWAENNRGEVAKAWPPSRVSPGSADHCGKSRELSVRGRFRRRSSPHNRHRRIGFYKLG